MREQLRRLPVLDDYTVIGEIDMFGNLTREAHFMRNQNAREAVMHQVANRYQHFLDCLRVERGSHFVKQHDRRTHRERTRNGDALLLSAGQFARIVSGLSIEANFFQ